jgi:MbtH protein
MPVFTREDSASYKVVVNRDEQYSVWPAYRPMPLGWQDVHVTGPKDDCLAYIKEIWVDTRPRSLRAKMGRS